MKKPTVIKPKVVQDENNIIEVSILAKSIVEISRGVHKLFGSGLNERAIVTLLHENSGVGKPAIRDVLVGLKNLELSFIVKGKK